jgi:hypothetical protein
MIMFKKSKMPGMVDEPYMRFCDRMLIEGVLKNMRPKRCLEWGAGFSTLKFPQCAGRDALWFSVEHDRDWFIKINGMNRNPNCFITHVSANHFPWTDPNGDGALSDLYDYIEYPHRFAPFDFILVDGRARKECLVRAFDWIKENGVVLLHDSERKYYHGALMRFKYQYNLFDASKQQTKIWMGSKGVDVYAQFKIKEYLALWRKLYYLRQMLVSMHLKKEYKWDFDEKKAA